MQPMDLHSLITIIAIGIASNLDNAGVGIAYGVRKIYISHFSNFMIALISFTGTLIAGYFGHWISQWVPHFVGNVIGAIIMIAVGVWVLWQPFIGKKERKREPVEIKKKNFITDLLRRPEEADFDQSKSLSTFESIVLGIALSINALAGGLDAGLTKINVLYTSLSVGIFSYFLLGLSFYLGQRYGAEKLKGKATLISGLLLIYIGFRQIL